MNNNLPVNNNTYSYSNIRCEGSSCQNWFPPLTVPTPQNTTNLSSLSELKGTCDGTATYTSENNYSAPNCSGNFTSYNQVLNPQITCYTGA